MSATFGSLFSGIGGLDLGLERAGWEVQWQVEIDDYCRSALTEHWPDIPRARDIRTVNWEDFDRVDLIAGGFPCQPFSEAGQQLGIADERWMWPEFARAIRCLRPRFVLVENVPALLRDADAFGWILRDLHALGFDAEWSVVSACSVGAPHPRNRLFLVAHAAGSGFQGLQQARGSQRLQPVEGLVRRGWPPEPDVARVADGVPRRLVADAVRAYGNAVVPQVAEWIGRRLLEAA